MDETISERLTNNFSDNKCQITGCNFNNLENSKYKCPKCEIK